MIFGQLKTGAPGCLPLPSVALTPFDSPALDPSEGLAHS